MLLKFSLLIFTVILLGSSIECRHVKKREVVKTLQSQITETTHHGSPLKRYRRAIETKPSEDTSESGHITSTEAKELLKLFGAMAWEEDKLEFLTGLVSSFCDSDSNMTLVGWQVVRSADGKADEYRTVELVIPPKPEEDDIGNFVESEESDEEEDEDDISDRLIPHNRVNMMRDVLRPFQEINLPASVYYASYYKDGNMEGFMHLDSDELLIEMDDFAIYNKTMHCTPEEAASIVERAQKIGRTAILTYGPDGKLIAGKSIIDPILIGNVLDNHEATDEMMLASPQIIGEVFTIRDNSKNVLAEIRDKFNKKFPDYKWNVLRDPENYFLTRDVTLSLSWDNMDFFEDTDTYFLVYGTKKM